MAGVSLSSLGVGDRFVREVTSEGCQGGVEVAAADFRCSKWCGRIMPKPPRKPPTCAAKATPPPVDSAAKDRAANKRSFANQKEMTSHAARENSPEKTRRKKKPK